MSPHRHLGEGADVDREQLDYMRRHGLTWQDAYDYPMSWDFWRAACVYNSAVDPGPAESTTAELEERVAALEEQVADLERHTQLPKNLKHPVGPKLVAMGVQL